MRYLIPLLLLLAACSDQPASVIGPRSTSPDAPELGTSLYASGTLHEEFQFYLDEGQTVRHGSYSAFFEGGAVQTTGFYREGLKDSVWTHFDEGGRTTLVHTWRQGRKWEGPFLLYWPNGNPSEYGTYRHGLWHGAYVSYYPSGKTEVRAQYVDDQLHGSYIEFYETGSRRVQGVYWRGWKNGTWRYFAESGLELQREEYDRGNLDSSGRVEFDLFDDGSIRTVIPYNGDTIHGVLIEYSRNGYKREERTYVDGRREGLAFTYWDNGRIKDQGRYNRGRKQGAWNTYSKGGQLTVEAIYDRGTLSGPYTSYYPNGAVQWEGTFRLGLKAGLWTNYTQDGEKRRQQTWNGNDPVIIVDCREDKCQ